MLVHINDLQFLEQRKLAPLALRLYDLFKRYGVDLHGDEKLRLWEMIGEHDVLAK